MATNPPPYTPYTFSRTTLRVPGLDTERLSLRGPRQEDFEDSVAMWGDLEVTRYILGRALSREEVWARHLRQVGHWAVHGFGVWTVRERAGGAFVGEIGLISYQRELGERAAWFSTAPEAAWGLAPAAQGKGYAAEAVKATLGWAKRALGAPRVVCIIDKDNAPSLAVARRCGFQPHGEVSYQGKQLAAFEHALAGLDGVPAARSDEN